MRATSVARTVRRRRHFRYRRFHAFHLDLAMVLLLAMAGWTLCPAPRVGVRSYRAAPMKVEIRVTGDPTADDLLRRPTLFAFRSPVGFSGGEPLPLPGCDGEETLPPALPSGPELPIEDFMPAPAAARRWPGDATVLRARLPEPPSFGEAEGLPAVPARLRSQAVRCAASDPDVVLPDLSALELRAMAGRTIRVHVIFGPDGGATAAVLGRHALPPDEAAELERLAMGCSGPAGASCQLVFHVPESGVAIHTSR